jgi:3-dehydroquinate dehydratase/shikimate dehydrogenase
MALADMLNASRQCGLLEVRLDRFDKAPDIGELLAHKPKPIIFSCRRKQDGGEWAGSEEERLALLRMCIVNKADYVEIEVDVADQIRKFPPAKRVISYTNLKETPENIGEIYAQAQEKHPDVIKLVTRADTPEEAWPLVQILAKPKVPTVVVGLGKPGVMLSVLGRKIGAPWIYAALERGMEAYPEQPTVADLLEVYDYPAIDRKTRLIGVTGFSQREFVTVAAVNAAMKELDLNARCLPLGIGNMNVFQKILDAVHLGGVLVDRAHATAILKIASEQETSAQEAGFADLIVRKSDNRFAHNTWCRAVVMALEKRVRGEKPIEKPLQGRMILIVGADMFARGVALALRRVGAVLIIASHDRQAAQTLAQALECRYVQWEALYTTAHDVLVLCDEEKEAALGKKRSGEGGIRPGYLKSGMWVVDAMAELKESVLLRDAAVRGCHTIKPENVLLEQLALQVGILAGKDAPRAVLESRLASLLED